MDEPNAIGHAFNIANARPLSQMEAVEAFAKACKKPVKFVRIPREYILRAGGHPMGPKLYFGVYFDMPPITQVTAKAQRVLKFKPTDFLDRLEGNLQVVSAAQRIRETRLRVRGQAAGERSGDGAGEGVAIDWREPPRGAREVSEADFLRPRA